MGVVHEPVEPKYHKLSYDETQCQEEGPTGYTHQPLLRTIVLIGKPPWTKE
jgi:hypothetical protein